MIPSWTTGTVSNVYARYVFVPALEVVVYPLPIIFLMSGHYIDNKFPKIKYSFIGNYAKYRSSFGSMYSNTAKDVNE